MNDASSAVSFRTKHLFRKLLVLFCFIHVENEVVAEVLLSLASLRPVIDALADYSLEIRVRRDRHCMGAAVIDRRVRVERVFGS